MGLCMSRGETTPTRAAPPPSKDTALVLMPSGEMREYPPHTATAARVLQDASASASADWFLCDADRVGFEGPVPALGGAEALRAGQIYFVLPAAARRRGLRREDVAALAVRASAALSARHSCARGKRSRRCGAVAPLVFAPPPPPEDEEEEHGRWETFVAARKAPPVRRHSRPTSRRSRSARWRVSSEGSDWRG
ncbi:uncharacterized protein LOC100279081 [Zea mays]|jgi:hypothetical protein|uniref:Uncharacterized protein n=1 Tax=Zea mays TaxID=4577 RepID=A0A1D6FAJ6_MAIZE|nr:uncharacterized protein LOC100279081 [Zea mays]ONM28094.1 hypothetical protein ZEAMMB73_Zm00001d007974 [Zea mays]